MFVDLLTRSEIYMNRVWAWIQKDRINSKFLKSIRIQESLILALDFGTTISSSRRLFYHFRKD